MVSLYESFIDDLTQILVFRAKNFVVTDCDLHAITDSVYDDICRDVRLEYVIQHIPLVKGTYEYQMPNYETSDDPNSPQVNYDYFLEMTDIVDDEMNNLELLTRVPSNGLFVLDKDLVDSHDGKDIHVMRNAQKNLRHLSAEKYNLIKPAMIDGLLYYIQDSIPSQVDSAIANLQYQRFYNGKKALIQRLPQTYNFDGRNVGSQSKIGVL